MYTNGVIQVRTSLHVLNQTNIYILDGYADDLMYTISVWLLNLKRLIFPN